MNHAYIRPQKDIEWYVLLKSILLSEYLGTEIEIYFPLYVRYVTVAF